MLLKCLVEYCMEKKYQIIYADPPWQYKNSDNLGKKSILNGKINFHYPTMTLEELKQLPIENIKDENCLLFLWVISPDLPMGLELMKARGFNYATIGFVWDKQRINPGYYTCSQVEICLIGKSGKIPQPRGSRKVYQFLSEKKTLHSSKPNEIRNRITEMFPTQNKIELFARQKTSGWDVWGNEVNNDIILDKIN